MMINLSAYEAKVLATITGTMIAGHDNSPRGATSNIFRKLMDAGAEYGYMDWHVNEYHNIELERLRW